MEQRDTTEWVEGFREGYGTGYSDGYRAGLEAGRTQAFYDAKAERKRAKYELKAQRRELKAQRYGKHAAHTQDSHGSHAGAEHAPSSQPRKGRKPIEATITGKESVSPAMVRIRANAPGLIGRELTKTDHYVKILFVPEGAPYSWPFDLAHIKDTQPKKYRPVTRTYTLRSVDTETGDIAIDFVLHGDTGLAGPWARDVEVGETFAFVGPGGGWAPTPRYDHFVLAGDESAAPAIAASLEKIPSTSTAIAFFEVEGPGHEFAVPEGDNITVRWVYRHGSMPGRALADAVRFYECPEGSVGWFVHGVAEMIKEIRRELYVGRGVSKKDASISGYWRLRMTEDQWQSSKQEFVAEMESAEQAAVRKK
ncbi:siderophore-interacting protein [Corynebacterium sp. zg254]|uniref:Siderophore-interacting protein n=1 Tax=Corynebacterium zhongnanshanii TaxID=2768834 RepID=A0ABQ6VDG3_9CORY|nr:siderophore-interacting protein [Corynebacterium sp. zg254]KAB3520955.1 siderophore-interacting protein [Corynebacterium zhongnanshanii]MCR5914586.1 siderophore-interacting protein [Corynebacterium sp. zg254]